jgi:hypothetical protein
MRRLLEIAAGLGLTWLALEAGGVAPPAEGSPSPPAPPAPLPDDASMARGADPVASYKLYATLDTTKHTIEGRGTITWRNASSVPQEELWVHLYLNGFKSPRTVFMRFPGKGSFRGEGSPSEWGSITVKRLALRGSDLWPAADKTSPGDPDDETDIRVPLPAPVAPGATLELDVEFESRLPNVLYRTGYHDGFYMVAQWFPKLALLSPDGRWAHFTFHHLSEFYADFGRYDVTVDTPDDMIVGAVGKLASEERHDKRVARRFVQDEVHDFAFAAYRDFRELTAPSAGGVAVRLLFPPGHERAAAVEMESVRFGLEHLGEAYGRYPYETLTVIHPPAGAEEAGGMEYPTLITTGGLWYLPWTGVRFLESVSIHELGHQWFYGMVATDEHTFPFLDEGINSYAEIEALETRSPHRSGFDGLGLSIGTAAYMRTEASDVERNAPVAQPASDFVAGQDYVALVYYRTATILITLANVYGKDRVRQAIGLYARRGRFQHPGPELLLSAVREVVGADAEAQLRAALFDRATVDYAVESIDSMPDDPPGTGWHGDVLVRRRGALCFPVDVDLVSADGAVQRVRWDAAESAAYLPYRGKSMLAAAVIDPEHLVLLDDDLGNNARAMSRSRVSAALLDRLAFAAGALLSGLSP